MASSAHEFLWIKGPISAHKDLLARLSGKGEPIVPPDGKCGLLQIVLWESNEQIDEFLAYLWECEWNCQLTARGEKGYDPIIHEEMKELSPFGHDNLIETYIDVGHRWAMFVKYLKKGLNSLLPPDYPLVDTSSHKGEDSMDEPPQGRTEEEFVQAFLKDRLHVLEVFLADLKTRRKEQDADLAKEQHKHEKTYSLIDFIRVRCEPVEYHRSIANRIHRKAKAGEIPMPKPINFAKAKERVKKMYRESDLIMIWPEIKDVIPNVPNIKYREN